MYDNLGFFYPNVIKTWNWCDNPKTRHRRPVGQLSSLHEALTSAHAAAAAAAAVDGTRDRATRHLAVPLVCFLFVAKKRKRN